MDKYSSDQQIPVYRRDATFNTRVLESIIIIYFPTLSNFWPVNQTFSEQKKSKYKHQSYVFPMYLRSSPTTNSNTSDIVTTVGGVTDFTASSTTTITSSQSLL